MAVGGGGKEADCAPNVVALVAFSLATVRFSTKGRSDVVLGH